MYRRKKRSTGESVVLDAITQCPTAGERKNARKRDRPQEARRSQLVLSRASQPQREKKKGAVARWIATKTRSAEKKNDH